MLQCIYMYVDYISKQNLNIALIRRRYYKTMCTSHILYDYFLQKEQMMTMSFFLELYNKTNTIYLVSLLLSSEKVKRFFFFV